MLSGLRHRMAPFQVMELDYPTVARGFLDPTPLVRAFEAAAQRALAAGAEVLIPGQMVFAGVLWQNGRHRAGEAPVVDALGACLKTAELLATLQRASGICPARRGVFGARPPAAVLARLLLRAQR